MNTGLPSSTPALGTAAIRVYIVEDHAMLRAALRSLIGRVEWIAVVGDNGDARSAIARIGELQPDVVLLDISMPGMSGLDAIEPLRKAAPRTRVLMLTHHEGETFVEQALRHGADGYLSKDSDPDELTLAIRSVHAGRTYLSPKVASGMLAKWRGGAECAAAPSNGISGLTSREREVLQLIALGRCNKEIAGTLRITLGTARKHRENLQRKLDSHSAADLTRLAIREGLLDS
jgi:DNA-binding NarL/FixJ family response regulator